jgi:adenylosuccinate synthase
VPAILVTGLGYGDEGKGAVVDYLAHTEDRVRGVVFTNGGAQRAHNVVSGKRHHTFSQFSSATFVPGVKTYHAATAMVDPHAFFLEADDLVEQLVVRPWERVTVHPEALITTPFHVAANKIHALHNGHGSCGMGIGETALDAIKYPIAVLRARDLRDPKVVYEKLHDAQLRMRRRAHSVGLLKSSVKLNQLFNTLHDFEPIKEIMEVYRIFAKVVRIAEFDINADPDQTWIFEGSQGVLLDEYSGFHPHTTWSKTAGQNAKNLLAEFEGNVRNVGVLRSFMTRHGAGPFVTEDPAMNDDERFAEHHNGQGEWQGAWRRGWTDMVALEYAARVAQPTELAITHMDRVRCARRSTATSSWVQRCPSLSQQRTGQKSSAAFLSCCQQGLTLPTSAPRTSCAWRPSMSSSISAIRPIRTRGRTPSTSSSVQSAQAGTTY